MEYRIKYRLKSKPTNIKKIGRIVSITGGLIFFFAGLLFTPFLKYLPLELLVFLLAEIIPFILTKIWLLGLAIFFLGIFLESLNWRSGIVQTDYGLDKIRVFGKFHFEISYSNLTEIAVFNNSVGLKRAVRFYSQGDKITLKFRTEESLLDFITSVTPELKKHEEVKIGSWVS